MKSLARQGLVEIDPGSPEKYAFIPNPAQVSLSLFAFWNFQGLKHCPSPQPSPTQTSSPCPQINIHDAGNPLINIRMQTSIIVMGSFKNHLIRRLEKRWWYQLPKRWENSTEVQTDVTTLEATNFPPLFSQESSSRDTLYPKTLWIIFL